MKVFRIVALVALLTGPVYAQDTGMKLIQSFDEKTPQQKADEELREKFSKEQQRPKIVPETGAKTSVDPWGNVRSGDASKTAASKTSNSRRANARTATSAKPRTKTGTDAD